MRGVTVTPVVGLPQQGGWAQVVRPDTAPIVCAFAVSGTNAGNVGRDVVDSLDVLEQVTTPSEFHQVLQTVLTEVADKGCELSLTAAYVFGERCALAAYQGNVILKRGAKVGQVLPPTPQLVMIEGSIGADDVLVVATDQATTLLGEIKQKLTQGYDIDTIVTSVVPGVHALVDSAQTAVAFVAVELPSEERTFPVSSRLSVVESEVMDSPTLMEEAPAMAADLPVGSPATPFPAPVSTPAVPVPRKEWRVVATGATGKLVTTVKRLLHKIFSKLSPGEPTVYLANPGQRRGWWKRVLIGLVVILILIWGGRWWWTQRQDRAAALTQVAPLQQQLTVAQAQVEQDPIAARDQVASLIEQLKTLVQAYENRPAGKAELQKILTDTESYYQSISGREAVAELPKFYDLRSAEGASEFIATAADLNGKLAYFLDGERRQLIRLNLENKQQQVITIESAGALKDVVALDDGAMVLGEQLVRVTAADEPQQLVVRPPEDQLKGGQFLAVFGQTAYVFHPGDKAIYRYAPKDGGGYDTPVNWLKSSPDLDLARVQSFVIDGIIWLSDSQGKIAKLSGGRPENFEVRGVPNGFNSVVALYTTPESDQLYVLDTAHKRVVTLSKDGTFVREVSSDSLAAGNVIIVSEELGKAFAVNGSIVYDISLGAAAAEPTPSPEAT